MSFLHALLTEPGTLASMYALDFISNRLVTLHSVQNEANLVTERKM